MANPPVTAAYEEMYSIAGTAQWSLVESWPVIGGEPAPAGPGAVAEDADNPGEGPTGWPATALHVYYSEDGTLAGLQQCSDMPPATAMILVKALDPEFQTGIANRSLDMGGACETTYTDPELAAMKSVVQPITFVIVGFESDGLTETFNTTIDYTLDNPA